MSYNKNDLVKLEDDILNCINDEFDINDIDTTNSKAKKFVNCLASLSKTLENPEVDNSYKSTLKQFYQNISLAYTDVIQQYIEYADKNQKLLKINFDIMERVQDFAGINIDKANKSKENLAITIAQEAQKKEEYRTISSINEPVSEASSDIESLSDFSSSKESQSVPDSSSESLQNSGKKRNFIKRAFDTISEMFKSNTRSNVSDQSNIGEIKSQSSLIKMIKVGIMGTKRTRDDPEITQAERISKKAKPTVAQPTPNTQPTINLSDKTQRETTRFRH